MPINTSIYQTAQPVQAPSVADSMQKALTISNMGLQNQNAQLANQQAQYQMQGQQAMRQAFADNTDENGNLNRQGALSQIAKVSPQLAMQIGQSLTDTDKSKANAQAAQADAASKTYNITGPAFDHLASMPEDQRAQAYPGVIQQLKDQGIDVSKMDHPYDPGLFRQYYGAWQNSKESLANQVSRSEIAKNNQDPFKTGAEELGKFNEDVNNASSRKTTGSLIDARTRADRVLSLVGRNPGESDTDYYGRLNQYMPQVGTEVGTSLAAIMQGGVPNESLQKEISPDTVSSKIAALQQKFKSEPTAANQGALLAAYGDIAQKLRSFSAGQLKQITDKSRSAYPYAAKYFPDRMDKIASQIVPATSQPQTSGGSLAGKGSAFSLVPNASASETPKQNYRPKGSQVSADQAAQYAIKHGMNLADAQATLKGMGYAVGN